jgi:hypothetical protein
MSGPLPCSTIAARGLFIGREDTQARAVAQVLCAARALQAGTGGRRQCLPTREMKYLAQPKVKLGTQNVNASKRAQS